MKNKCLFWGRGLFLLAICLPLAAAGPYVEKGLFYHAQKGGFSVWLFGSVHNASPAVYPLPAKVMAAYAASEALAEETDLGSLDRQRLARILAVHGKAQDPLEESVGEELAKRVRDFFAKQNMDSALFEYFRPWFIAVTLSSFQLEEKGYSYTMGIDAYFADLAQKDNKPLLALETPEEQFAVFGALTAEQEKLLLEDTMNSLDTQERKTERELPLPSSEPLPEAQPADEIMQAWLAGDEQKIAELVQFSKEKGKSVLQDFEDSLILSRNKTMASHLEELAAQKSYKVLFVVVGAGHLAGPQGIPALLGEAGWQTGRQ